MADLNVSAEDLLAAVLDATTQPICAVDPGGVIRFANAAALAALGYDSAAELVGRRSRESLSLPLAGGETVASDLDWFVRRDGSTFPVAYVAVPLGMPDGRGAVVAFTDVGNRVEAEQARREQNAVPVAQQASLRRVASLVAGGASSADVFAAIAREVAHVLRMTMVQIWRYELNGTATVLGAWSGRPHPFRARTNWPFDDPTILGLVQQTRTGRPVKIDDMAELSGTADAAREIGIRSVVGAPVVVDGELWGMIGAAAADPELLPDGVEDRLAEFTELVAAAISSTASRDELARLADEQAALRRVATLVARESPSAEVFAAVAAEVGLLLGVDSAHLCRYESDASAAVVGSWGGMDTSAPVGTRAALGGENILTLVLRTGRPARVDDYTKASGYLGAVGRKLGLRSAVGAPVIVDGRLWGAVLASSRAADPLPADTESRIQEFTELVATAISNVQARTELAASRARIAAAADEERRRVVRDLHDGAQQRLIHAAFVLQRALDRPDVPPDVRPLVEEGLIQARSANGELRELAHGIHPAILTNRGLAAAVEELADRVPLPVEMEIPEERYPLPVEATAYFVVAEALTNVAKHAHARHATVMARIEDGTLAVHVRDDGVGGARPEGSGFIGLADRLAVLDGHLSIESPVGRGTLICADIPLPG